MSRIFFFFAACLLVACHPPARMPRQTSASNSLVNDGKLWASLFQQRAAEYRALCQQAFNIARLRVDQASALMTLRPMAVVTDIDETILDNSPYAVHQALLGMDYTASSWKEWTSKAAADTLQGSLTFFRYAASKGMEVFYITNRDETERTSTLANLRRFNFPFADDQHLIMRADISSKETRRSRVAATHDIVLLLGDNLADFSQLFDKKTEAERMLNERISAEEFGNRFIILPNSTYGGWEDAFFLYNLKLTPAQKDSLIRSALKGF
ncbi:MAG: 5'-nucleotidase, lipoprotein e(P4) family [Chitinophagaceae bacterium]